MSESLTATEREYQPTWANSPERRILATCPDCSAILDMPLQVTFKRRGSYVYPEFGVARVRHSCEFSALKAAATRRLAGEAA